MGSLASMELCMSFKIVQTAESRVAPVTIIGLFLTMCKKVAFQVVMPGEVCVAVRALMPLDRRRGVIPIIYIGQQCRNEWSK